MVQCPEHKLAMEAVRGWKRPAGVSREVKKMVCLDCSEYWYLFPDDSLRRSLKNKKGVRQ